MLLFLHLWKQNVHWSCWAEKPSKLGLLFSRSRPSDGPQQLIRRRLLHSIKADARNVDINVICYSMKIVQVIEPRQFKWDQTRDSWQVHGYAIVSITITAGLRTAGELGNDSSSLTRVHEIVACDNRRTFLGLACGFTTHVPWWRKPSECRTPWSLHHLSMATTTKNTQKLFENNHTNNLGAWYPPGFAK